MQNICEAVPILYKIMHQYNNFMIANNFQSINMIPFNLTEHNFFDTSIFLIMFNFIVILLNYRQLNNFHRVVYISAYYWACLLNIYLLFSVYLSVRWIGVRRRLGHGRIFMSILMLLMILFRIKISFFILRISIIFMLKNYIIDIYFKVSVSCHI